MRWKGGLVPVRTDTRSKLWTALSVRAWCVGAVLLTAYFAVLLALMDSRPLWLDEVLQLEGTTRSNWRNVIQYVFVNPGGAPLGYLAQHWIIAIAGCSIWTARALSAVAGAGCLLLYAAVAHRLGFRGAAVTIAISSWAVCPLAVRYSLEGRPYMQGLFFALAAVAAQLYLARTGRIHAAIVLGVCLVAALYSQPFAVFAPLGFSACQVAQSRNSRCAVLTFAAYALAGLSFVPWLILATPAWHQTIAHIPGGFVWSPSLALVLLRECVGDGYPAAAPALLLAIAGAVAIARRPFRDRRLPLAAAVLASVGLALAADARFHYFFAARQLIYMVPFLLLLAAEGLTMLWARPRLRAPAVVLAGVFLIAAVHKDYVHLRDRSEDWGKLSQHLTAAARGGCILLPGDSASELGLYTVFSPGIAHQICDPALSSARIVIPLHPYVDREAAIRAEHTLLARGMTHVGGERVGFASIELFAKRD